MCLFIICKIRGEKQISTWNHSIGSYGTHGNGSQHCLKSRRKTENKVSFHIRVLTNCEPASQRVMRVEPASHASHASHHVSHARQMLVPSPFSFLRLLAAFGYLARVFAILALLSISFCYLPSSFSSFVKVNSVICYYFSRVLNR